MKKLEVNSPEFKTLVNNLLSSKLLLPPVNSEKVKIDIPISPSSYKKIFNLYHVTTLNGLYSILNSGYIDVRNRTGAIGGFSPVGHLSSGDWVYLGLNPELPSPGEKSIQLVLSSDILNDRNDYFLNYDWNYGKTSESLPATKLEEFLRHQNPLRSEIIFESRIPIDKYLLLINVIQLPDNILQKIPLQYRNQLDIKKIPEKYRKVINIISKT